MFNRLIPRGPAVALILGIVAITPAHATQRTFVSGSGNDANLCTLAAPCRGFARAMSLTDTGGEIVALDSAGYGAFTIDRSVSIISPLGVYAGVSVFAPFAGITVDAPGAKVALKGLSINGQGGPIGVWMLHGAELHIENCVISGVGNGLLVQAGSISVKDTIIRDSGQDGVKVINGAASAHFDNVRVQDSGSVGVRLDQVNASLRTSIVRSTVTGNGYTGIIMNTNGNSLNVLDIDSTEITSNGWAGMDRGVYVISTDAGSIAEVSIANAVIARNRIDGFFVYSQGGTVHGSITDSTVTGNYGYGLAAAGPDATLIASHNTITRNGSGGMFANSGATLYSRQDNRAQGNFGAGDATGTTSLPGL